MCAQLSGDYLPCVRACKPAKRSAALPQKDKEKGEGLAPLARFLFALGFKGINHLVPALRTDSRDKNLSVVNAEEWQGILNEE